MTHATIKNVNIAMHSCVSFSGPGSRPSRTVSTCLIQFGQAMRLSPQHSRVVECVLRGLCDQQIADHLNIHKSTLRTYFDRISMRTGAHGRLAILRHVLTVSHQLNG